MASGVAMALVLRGCVSMYFILPCVLQVYDATPFLEDHPGGADSIIIVAGQDATEDFNAIHSKKVSRVSGGTEQHAAAHLWQ
jgi:hypothetical protein